MRRLAVSLCLFLAPPAVASAAPLAYDAPPGGSALTLERSGPDLRIVDDATQAIVASGALGDMTRVDVRGADAGDGHATGESNDADGPQSGTLALDDLRIAYANVEPITDTVPVVNFAFTAPAATTRISLANAPTPGQLTISDLGTGTFESETFANKTNVTINAGSTQVGVNLDNSVSATGMASLTVNGTPLDDTFRVTSTTAPTTVNGANGNDTYLLSGTGPAAAPPRSTAPTARTATSRPSAPWPRPAWSTTPAWSGSTSSRPRRATPARRSRPRRSRGQGRA